MLAVALATSFAMAATSSMAYNAATDAQDVTIQESAITGAAVNLLTADQLSGQYDEIFSVTGPGTFNTLAFFNAGDWFLNSNPAGTQIGLPENFAVCPGCGYQLYALFQSDGTFTPDGSGGFSFTGGNGTIELWADPLQNSTKTLPGTAAPAKTLADIVIGLGADDLKLGTASLLSSGDGSGNPGSGANGDFELVFGDWVLESPNGEAYFVGPRPFHFVLDLNGNFQAFNPLTATDTLITANSANAFFVTVPEPGSLALIGLGLTALGFGTRRRNGATR